MNRRLLLEKEKWTLYILSFSFIRNNFHWLCKKRKKTEMRQPSWKAQKLVRNLQIFDGLKSILSCHVSYALAFYCAYYQVI